MNLGGEELKELHDTGYWRVQKMQWMCDKRRWEVHASDLQELVKKCPVCQWLEFPKLKAQLRGVYRATYPGMPISMDVVGPLPTGKRGGKYIICVIDHLTRWGEASVLFEANSFTIVRVLRN